jgi:dimethylargininase
VIAVTRDVSPAIANAELTHLDRSPISYERAVQQHESYRALLQELGCEVVTIAGDVAYPDCVFIEDTAVVLSDLAVITRPGAESRRGEVDAVANVLTQYRKLVRIESPATIDGGDVLVLDEKIYVGLSSRTNEEAITQLRSLTGREVIGVGLQGALHLKTGVTRVAANTLLINREWVDAAIFNDWNLIDVDPAEPFSANAVLIGETVIFPEAFRKTRGRLKGLDVRSVPADELAKAEGGVTCCSLLIG